MNAKALLLLISLAISPILKAAEEVPVTIIPLAAPLNEPDAEISGLTWCDDTLIVLPQYPERLNEEGISYLWGIEKSAIHTYLDGAQPAPLSAKKIVLEEGNLRAKVPAFDGYEALTCQGDEVWFSIEAGNALTAYHSYVVRAKILPHTPQTTIQIDTQRLWRIPSSSGLPNKGEEAILLAGDRILTLHEVNDPRLMPHSQATSINIQTGAMTSTPFPHLPYRVTDSTELDPQNRFWLMNYKYSGDKFSRSAIDPLAQQYGEGPSHKQYYNVERLVEFELSNSGIKRVEQAPIQLQMTGVEGRNWEGLVRLDQRGFLIATDKHPVSLLGFVPYPNQATQTTTVLKKADSN